jgi:hypothetical protein
LDPSSDLFDPIKGAVLHGLAGQADEAFWLVFLSVHFGRDRRSGWRLVRDVYGRLGDASYWTWNRTSSDPQAFRRWLASNIAAFRGNGRRFGNHRKYQSLDAWTPAGTGAAVETYVGWVAPPRTHRMLIEAAREQAGGDPRRAFDLLYRSMAVVKSFGRTARFDYLTMVAKVGLAAIDPGSTYLEGATGPLVGAELLFGVNVSASFRRSTLDTWLVDLGAELDVGMQVLEDALCNWQKSPDRLARFRG